MLTTLDLRAACHALLAQRAPVRTSVDTSEVGVSGTPVFGGFLRDLGEYNTTLAGATAFATYEQMRRSDAQVAATLAAVKLPIRGAEWQIVPPESPSAREQEAADFIRAQLFERIDFKRALENALLMLDFGCSAHEDVYAIDGGRIVLRKLAPRLPHTFQRFLVDAAGELLAIEQQGYGGETYKTVAVPAAKLALFTHQREGDNYAGRSLLRPAYKHWYSLQALEKIAAIGAERNGMGVPTMTMGGSPKTEDRTAALAWLEQLSVHQKTAMLLPPEWQFVLRGVEGQTRDPMALIEYHRSQISTVALAQFLLLGQQASGSRALGETLGDFFLLSLQAVAEDIAATFNRATIARLVAMNFGGVRQPRLIAAQIFSLKLDAIVAALKDLGQVVLADDELEAWLRKKLGAPEKGANPRPVPAPGAEPAKKLSEVAARQYREARGAERWLALDDITHALDRGRDTTAALLRRARSAMQASIVHRLVSAPVRSIHRVSVPPSEELIAAVQLRLVLVAEFGRDQVEQERDRQHTGSAREVRLAAKKRRDPLGVYAEGAVSEFANNLTARAANVVLDLKRRLNVAEGDLIREAERRLDEQSDKWIDSVASKAANNAFADGRAEGYADYADEIAEVQYSAILDANTCEPCQAADGRTGRKPEDVPDVPNPDCAGGDKCRCVHVFVFGDEVRPKEAA